MTRTIDINCDLGEGFGNYSFGFDDHMLATVSTANVACGFHAGDPLIMRETVRKCVQNDVRIGAHPGLPDLLGFGRRRIAASAEDVYAYWSYQMGALGAFVTQQRGVMGHAKPHGAMYQLMATDAELARAALQSMNDYDPGLRLFFPGPLTDAVAAAAEEFATEVVQEVYVDLSYGDDGSILVERNKRPVSLDAVRDRVRLFVQEGQIQCVSGRRLPVDARSICVHSDTPNAIEILDAVLEVLAAEGVEVSSP